ncbi:MAG: hypothetical protein U0936_27785 [Planctomycetaceae bacterium]
MIAPPIASLITTESSPQLLQPAINPQNLERELVKRGIGPASAEELSLLQPSNRIREMLDSTIGTTAEANPGPGFLVQSIKNPSAIGVTTRLRKLHPATRTPAGQRSPKLGEANVRTERERLALRKTEFPTAGVYGVLGSHVAKRTGYL